MKPWLHQRPEESVNQSTSGEDHPCVAFDPMSRSGEDARISSGMIQASGALRASQASDKSDRAQLLRRALSRWENEGGADGEEAPASAEPGEAESETDVHLTNAELVQLQIRVIALENLVIALLAGATAPVRDLAREMAANISPRLGSTPHRLTIHAAAQMVHLIERSSLFQNKTGKRPVCPP